jgi:hypothetical protein
MNAMRFGLAVFGAVVWIGYAVVMAVFDVLTFPFRSEPI